MRQSPAYINIGNAYYCMSYSPTSGWPSKTCLKYSGTVIQVEPGSLRGFPDFETPPADDFSVPSEKQLVIKSLFREFWAGVDPANSFFFPSSGFSLKTENSGLSPHYGEIGLHRDADDHITL